MAVPAQPLHGPCTVPATEAAGAERLLVLGPPSHPSLGHISPEPTMLQALGSVWGEEEINNDFQ